MSPSHAEPRPGPTIIIVMGVSGSGKTTLAENLAKVMGWDHAEADEFHPQANIDKMASGHPLTDEDRWPWLRLIGDWINTKVEANEPAIVTCSALRRVYRDLLREGRPQVRFCHVIGDEALLAERMRHREHFMPPMLLPSQFATLEPLEADELAGGDVEVSVAGTPEETLAEALEALNLTEGAQ